MVGYRTPTPPAFDDFLQLAVFEQINFYVFLIYLAAADTTRNLQPFFRFQTIFLDVFQFQHCFTFVLRL